MPPTVYRFDGVEYVELDDYNRDTVELYNTIDSLERDNDKIQDKITDAINVLKRKD